MRLTALHHSCTTQPRKAQSKQKGGDVELHGFSDGVRDLAEQESVSICGFETKRRTFKLWNLLGARSGRGYSVSRTFIGGPFKILPSAPLQSGAPIKGSLTT